MGRIAWDAKGALLAYRDWPKLREPPESVSVDNWPIGQSGILYPVSFLRRGYSIRWRGSFRPAQLSRGFISTFS